MNEDIKKILEVLGVTRHKKWKSVVILGDRYYCDFEIQDDLNAIRELELMVMEKFGTDSYGEILCDAITDPRHTLTLDDCAYIATADAPTRIAAMVAVLEGENV